MTIAPSDLPPALQPLLVEYRWRTRRDGLSGADVYALDAPGAPPLFVKSEAPGPFATLAEEAAAMAWLHRTSINCPGRVAFVRTAERDWLVSTALAGHSFDSAIDATGAVIDAAAGLLVQLHQLDPASCPVDRRAARDVAAARARLDAGLVDADNFDDERRGRSAAGLFDELAATLPADDDLVVTHGDATFANMIVRATGSAGLVDLGRLGVGDRHRDLALVLRDVAEYFGNAGVARFLARYGRPADPARLAFYTLLDEFF